MELLARAKAHYLAAVSLFMALLQAALERTVESLPETTATP